MPWKLEANCVSRKKIAELDLPKLKYLMDISEPCPANDGR